MCLHLCAILTETSRYILFSNTPFVFFFIIVRTQQLDTVVECENSVFAFLCCAEVFARANVQFGTTLSSSVFLPCSPANFLQLGRVSRQLSAVLAQLGRRPVRFSRATRCRRPGARLGFAQRFAEALKTHRKRKVSAITWS